MPEPYPQDGRMQFVETAVHTGNVARKALVPTKLPQCPTPRCGAYIGEDDRAAVTKGAEGSWWGRN